MATELEKQTGIDYELLGVEHQLVKDHPELTFTRLSTHRTVSGGVSGYALGYEIEIVDGFHGDFEVTLGISDYQFDGFRWALQKYYVIGEKELDAWHGAVALARRAYGKKPK